MRFIIIFCTIMLFSCGSGEETHDANMTEVPEPNYFPNTIDSSWVYKNPDEKLLTRRVDKEIRIGSHDYVFLETTPIDTNADLLIPTFFRLTDDNVLFEINAVIHQYIKEHLLLTVKDEFEGLDVDVFVNSISNPNLIFLPIPLSTDYEWNVLNLNISGNIILQDLTILNIPFELMLNINGDVLEKGLLTTPVESFENAYQIQYTTEITNSVLSKSDTLQLTQTIWFVPKVGIVKIKDESGVTELIEYSIEPLATK